MLNLPVYLYTPAIRVFVDLENSTRRGVEQMYHGYATIAKGLKNTLKFVFLNGDQRPIDVSSKTFVFKVFDRYTNNEVLEESLTIIDDGTNYNVRGLASVTLSGVDTRNLTTGLYNYSILEVDGAQLTASYIDGSYSMSGNLEITDGVVPKRIPSEQLTFTENQNQLFTAGPIAANRDGKGNNLLHTFQIYFTNFTGSLVIKGTMENDPTLSYVTIQTLNYTNQNGTLSINLTDMRNINYFKFEYTRTSGSIDKILFRS